MQNLERKKKGLWQKEKNIDIQFPPPFYKICGKHAKYFKSEAQVCIRQKAPLQVNSWSEITKDDVDEMWKHMKDALSLSDEVKEYAMKQIQSQYKNKLYHLHQLYLKKKGRPKNVSPDDWNWLINNKWSDLKFQERSFKNKVN
ncbi:uncharacterized protein LOC109793221 [Cajanus cajan]|uniref:uncharacterized protein LOC109793221 n=1 Tax=Cajanus cajan TaxID=3821 RepID=UPI0010FB15A6|nr:uncharacterized protein LOC109793221 [Cajanus cajan]